MISIVLVLFALILLTISVAKERCYKKDVSHPPGPFPLPFLGNIHQLGGNANPYQKLSDWASRYGKIYSIQLASKKAVVINCPKLMKDIFSLGASTGKYKCEGFLIPTKGQHGIINTEGKIWQQHRNMAITSLAEFGFGKKSLEDLIILEALALVDWIKKDMEIPSDGLFSRSLRIGHSLQLATVNTLWSIISGERFQIDDEAMAVKMEALVQNFVRTVRTGFIFFPFLKHIAPNWSGYHEMIRSRDVIHDFVGQRFEAHKVSKRSGVRKDVIDCYIEKMNGNDESSIFHGSGGEQNARSAIVEIIIGGSETTASTITCVLFYLCQHQKIQNRVHQEIDEVIGHCREPSLMDKKSLRYFEAVILETLRLSSLLPVGFIHELLSDIQCGGFTLSKGTLLVANIYHVHHSKEIWGDPENFRPERFLENSTGENRRGSVIPFQVGRRRCLGESLAMDVIFLFCSKLLQQFTVLPDENASSDDYMKPEIGYVLMPKPIKIQLKCRI